MSPIELSVSEFIASCNQTLEFAYPNLVIIGELANLRVSKNQWVYFDLKDENATLKCFGTVYQLPGPLEDGMLLRVHGIPRLHTQYGFSFTVQSIQPVGAGTLKRAADLLAAQLEKEGVFDESRKRILPYPPKRIGLITSSEAAAYADFVKILNERWGGISVEFINVPVQGETAPEQIRQAVKQFNQQAVPPDVLVITRGGGSPDDLWAFNTELVTRAVAESRVPTLVAIGHETDVSLSERAADCRASTPSNAAQLLVPDRYDALLHLKGQETWLQDILLAMYQKMEQQVVRYYDLLKKSVMTNMKQGQERLKTQLHLLELLSPESVLKRGYAIVRHNEEILRSGAGILRGDTIVVTLNDATITANVQDIHARG